jgi:hypothetical protein
MKRFLLACTLCLATASCTMYYKVTDLNTGQQYYTSNLRQKGNGAATFTDGRTGNTVTLQNTEVKQIKKQEYDTGRFTPPATSPATRP